MAQCQCKAIGCHCKRPAETMRNGVPVCMYCDMAFDYARGEVTICPSATAGWTTCMCCQEEIQWDGESDDGQCSCGHWSRAAGRISYRDRKGWVPKVGKKKNNKKSSS